MFRLRFVFFGVVATLFATAEGGGALRGAPGVSTGDVEAALISELMGIVAGEVPAHLENALRPTFDSLPKNEHGNIDHQAVRYALHRMFVHQHGWFIKGLEPSGGDTWYTTASTDVLNESWVPSYLQNLLEKRMDSYRGITFQELAALAGAIESIIHTNAGRRLELIYDALGYSKEREIGNTDMEEILDTYMVDFLDTHPDGGRPVVDFLDAGGFTAESAAKLRKLKDTFHKDYTGWSETEAWLRKLEGKHLSSSNSKWLNLKGTKKIVEEIGEEFTNFNDKECRSLKSMLIELESSKAGRVRLSDFYNKSMYSHWELSEKPEYLRALGALDESEPNRPHVIIPNYVGARQNCVEVSSIFAVCCRDECEDLMGSLEREIGDAAGDPSHIIRIVSGLESDTVKNVPRTLNQKLLDRLNEVANKHGGKVPLHGRLFAQWMHHAFPNECQFPHEVGTTNPMSVDEWIKETGDDSCKISAEEMRNHIVQDSSTGEFENELPWTESEELLSVSAPAANAAKNTALRNVAIAVAVLGTVILSWISMRQSKYSGPELDDISVAKAQIARDRSRRTPWPIIAFGSFVTLTLATETLDATVFGFVLVGGLAVLALTRVMSRRSNSAKKM